MTRRLTRSLVSLLLLFSASSSSAQLLGDQVPRERIVPLRESVEAQMEASRYRLGPIYVQPDFRLTNLGYVDNVLGVDEESGEEKVDDFTATVGAGFRFLAPVTNKVFVRGTIRPEYTYYVDLEELRRFGGVYDASALAFFNRLSVETLLSRGDVVDSVNPEADRPVEIEQDRAFVRAEVDLFRKLGVFSAYETQDSNFNDEIPDEDGSFETLERRDSAVRYGFRYKPRDYFNFTIMAENTDTEFGAGSIGFDNTTDAIIGGISYDRSRLYLNLMAGTRELKPDDPALPSFDGTTGSYFLAYALGAPLEIQFFGERSIFYSFFEDNPFAVQTRNGIGLKIGRGGRLTFFGSAEAGKNEYEVPVSIGQQLVQREDDVRLFTGGALIRVGRRVGFRVEYTDSEYDSNVEGRSRSVSRFGVNLVFGSSGS